MAFDVAKGYFAVLAAREEVAVLEEEERFLESRLQQVENMQRLGAATGLDVLFTRAEKVGVRPGLIRARGVVEIAGARFNTTLGRPVSDPVILAPPIDDPVALPSYRAALAAAEHNRVELSLIDAQHRVQQKLVNIDRNFLRPDMYAFGQYGAQAAPSLADLLDKNFFGWTAGITLDFPLFVGLENRGRLRQSQSRLREIEYRRIKLKKAIAVDVNAAVITTRQTGQAHSASLEVLSASELALIAALKAQEIGAATTLMVLDARRRFLSAQRTTIQARYSHLQSLAALKHAMGADILAPMPSLQEP